ncbi:beta-ketoacyl synthase N-terminal-like domain-containing protein [Streptomyces rugosispiralis]|uniref:3-oxoacyl-ACP synthase n=1 Tax=Streptomyces rugosispiralis TaxID=2967341 RepID=A0ABT1UNX2_9ACTN|nr:beta-ketoacyl synthase N-terminal-like domain-containing protein [Streptomyces rugosispiralis]MCQ8186820.1 3-oxoacyl-ACP synthase [Streptomyces rugosispiralis]
MTMNPDGVTVTAHALHVPDPIGGSVATAARDLFASVAPEPACGPDQAHTVLGRKGLLFKEDATRLALCAVHRAFGLPPGKLTEPLPGAEHTAVVVSSNVGNARTVRDIVTGMRAGSAHDVSPLNGPNASSNVIASTLAIRYGFTGPNLMVCSGATSGLDAIRLGVLLLRGERARRVVVVGVEPDDEVAGGLAALRPAAPGTTVPVPLRAAAACVVLEPGGAGPRLGNVRRHTRPDDIADDLRACVTSPAGDVTQALTPPAALRLTAPGAPGAGGGIDLTPHLGEVYGALGVVQLAVAAAWLGSGQPSGPGGALITCGDGEDGYASVRLDPADVPAPAGGG